MAQLCATTFFDKSDFWVMECDCHLIQACCLSSVLARAWQPNLLFNYHVACTPGYAARATCLLSVDHDELKLHHRLLIDIGMAALQANFGMHTSPRRRVVCNQVPGEQHIFILLKLVSAAVRLISSHRLCFCPEYRDTNNFLPHTSAWTTYIQLHSAEGRRAGTVRL